MSFKTFFLALFVISSSLSYSQYDPDYNSNDDEDLSQLAFKDRLYTGGNFWAQFGNVTNVEISPMLGYRVTNEYSAGVGVRYNFYKFTNIAGQSYSTSIYGGSIFNRYLFLQKFVAHAELELLNFELQRTATLSERKWVPIGLVGGGYSANGFQLMLLYDLIGSPSNPIGGNFINDRLYSMLPIYNFSLKPKIREITRIPRVTNTLGDHIRKHRLERNIDQQDLAKQFGVTSVALSLWELNRKPTPPKHLQNIIDFLGYVPKIKMGFDRFGTHTQLYRIHHEMSLQVFSEHIDIEAEEINHLEQGKYGKRHRLLESKITVFLKDLKIV